MILYRIILTFPRYTRTGRKAKSLVTEYLCMGESEDAALARFDNEIGFHHRDGARLEMSVVDGGVCSGHSHFGAAI